MRMAQREIQKLKETILKEYPRLKKDDKFKFACHSGVSCFNECCGDVNIFLTPYDVLRLKNTLGISSQEFLDKYTILPIDQNQRLPVVLLKMQDNEKKTCYFVSKEGCTVYENRPWACRMYPLGLASPGELAANLNEEFYFILKESVCKGFNENREWTVREWIEDQGIAEYDKFGEMYKQIYTHPYLEKAPELTPQKIDMFFLACYNLDKFRDFILHSTFLQKFDVEDDLLEKIKTDDEELLKFGFRWVRFALFGEKTIDIKDDVKAMAEKKLEEKRRKTAK
ncbi:MAG TPA: YkgJ family cysteine cluster protein [candidate division Zixibacteria bacterium]|nr:YkgJ family cysteine cluster protein [candidate division Zixibacteria bacterium]HER00028.1 YkgJ family cysteine cluster protein [candidate division Zixibacteria bacterium]